MTNSAQTSADDFTKSFEQKLIEQFGESPLPMTEGEYRLMREEAECSGGGK